MNGLLDRTSGRFIYTGENKMSLNLNVEIDRRGTNSVKWEFMWQDEVLTYMDHADLDQHGPYRSKPHPAT